MKKLRFFSILIITAFFAVPLEVEAQTFRELYENIALTSYDNQWQIEVFPGGDPRDIHFSYEYAQSLRVLKDGSLEVKTVNGSYIEPAPVAWQENVDGKRTKIEGRYVLDGKEVRMQLGAYEMAQVLVINIPGVSKNMLFFLSDPMAFHEREIGTLAARRR